MTLTNEIRAREADSRSAGQEHPRLLWKRNVHYRCQQELAIVPYASQTNPIYSLISQSYKIHIVVVW
jgi:hypothetical protein